MLIHSGCRTTLMCLVAAYAWLCCTTASTADARGKGVLVMLNDQISDARDVTKTDSHNVDTFRNWELGFLGYMLNGTPHFYRISTRKHTDETEFDVANLDSVPKSTSCMDMSR